MYCPFGFDSKSSGPISLFPSSLRLFVSAVIMLQCHIHWVNSLCDEECTPKKNRLNDDVVPQSTLCRVLDCFISAMRKVHYCENDELVKLDILLQNFELSCEDIKHLHEWNSYCGGGMKLSPVIG